MPNAKQELINALVLYMLYPEILKQLAKANENWAKGLAMCNELFEGREFSKSEADELFKMVDRIRAQEAEEDKRDADGVPAGIYSRIKNLREQHKKGYLGAQTFASASAIAAAGMESSAAAIGKKVLIITDSDAFAVRVMNMQGRFKQIEIVKMSGFDSLDDERKIKAARDGFNIVETYTYFTNGINGISETMRLWCADMALTDLSGMQPDAASDALEEDL
jgi:hypothetical protein